MKAEKAPKDEDLKKVESFARESESLVELIGISDIVSSAMTNLCEYRGTTL